jgi:hypothetical protein
VYQQQLASYQLALQAALRTQYKEIFLLTSGVCLLGAVGALLLGNGRTRQTTQAAHSVDNLSVDNPSVDNLSDAQRRDNLSDAQRRPLR